MNKAPALKEYAIVVLVTVIAAAFIGFFYKAGLKTSMFLFAWQLNFALMAWVTVINAQFKPSLQSPYFNTFAFEDKGRIYTRFGINWFRRFLLLIGWEKITRKNMPVSTNIADLKKYERASRESEFGHWVVAIIVMAVSIYVGFTHSFLRVTWLMVLNVLFNIYPILLQRYNRPRLQTLISKYSSVKAKAL